MKKVIISLILLLTPLGVAVAAEADAIRADAPDRYTVVRGDTLWGISGRFLRDAWRWPEVWRLNRDEIRNPHLIFPGNVIVLDRATGRLSIEGRDGGATATARAGGTAGAPQLATVSVSPRVRLEALDAQAIPTIKPSDIAGFLSKPLLVGRDELDGFPSIVATEEDRISIGAGGKAYAEGIKKEAGLFWQVYRRGDPLVDPESNEVLGYETFYLGEARVIKYGELTTLEITSSTREINRGDRLLPASQEKPVFAYVPRAPEKPVKAYIVSAYGNLGETGPLGIVALSKGSRDGLEVGHVLAIHTSTAIAKRLGRYGLRTSALYGREGLSGSDSPRTYYSPELSPRDGPLYGSVEVIDEALIRKLPDERYGLVMVFRTFERASFGLVMEASRPVALYDAVMNP
ncbi:MAG: LysM peptidoglycan-binding domain-containing protein [Betaproteobacteria bacterium]|nr:LysM peptidoglycan-binding domain-containing protein [Betaproteobacteria bacterium]